jgi:hypothetical protein
MNPGRVIALAILVYLIYSYAGIVRSGIEGIRTLAPRLRTLGEMREYKAGLEGYLSRFRDLPTDLYGWLNENYPSLRNPNPGQDPFGTPYIVERSGRVILRSAGGDRVFYTKDDLLVVLRTPED